MSLVEVFIIGVGLSMDAFAVSICKGLSFKEMSWKKALIPGVYFGVFQALMPLLGYLLGSSFRSAIEAYDHWIAFVLLAAIGVGMLKEAKGDVGADPALTPKAMVPLAVATSIDALAVGVSLGVLRTNILIAVAIIGITTFILSTLGFKVGNMFGSKYRGISTVAGGVILIAIGFKILSEHLGII